MEKLLKAQLTCCTKMNLLEMRLYEDLFGHIINTSRGIWLKAGFPFELCDMPFQISFNIRIFDVIIKYLLSSTSFSLKFLFSFVAYGASLSFGVSQLMSIIKELL